MKYQKGSKVVDNMGEKFIIDEISSEQTPIGDTLFFILRSRKNGTPNQYVTKWMLDTYFELID